MHAVIWNQTECVRSLINGGADKEAKNMVQFVATWVEYHQCDSREIANVRILFHESGAYLFQPLYIANGGGRMRYQCKMLTWNFYYLLFHYS
jgi:hypothetical protein